jgi:asparagine synthase (glutamine-hydrolysing)
MCARMVHRGPDDEGSYVDSGSGFALGARRLSIIDVAGGHQPVSNEDGTVWAVLNGEIYNHPALQRYLEQRGHRLGSRTDTEVLVHLYEEYGDALVDALEGMFAFAVWDCARGKLVLARDRFGEKPLFYHAQGDRLRFASELTALGAGSPGPLVLAPAAVHDYYVLGYVSGERSLVEGVSQLPPAHVLTWSREERTARLRRYWTAPRRPTTDSRSDHELGEELEFLLRGAVRSRLLADVPVGVFLSGGLDSSLVARLARDEHSGRLRTFTVSYDVGAVNEDAEARAIARNLDAEHHEIVLEQHDIERRVLSTLGSIDQPNADPALIALHGVAEHARPMVTVALGGEGADEIFGGYPRYQWLARAARSRQYLPAAVAGPLAKAIHAPLGEARLGRLARVVCPADLVDTHIDWVTADRHRLAASMFGPRLSEVGNERVVRDARRIVGSPEPSEVVSRFMELDQSGWLPDDVLCKADRATMFASLEMRTPFLDRTLVEFAGSIVASRLVRHNGKAVLRSLYKRTSMGGWGPPKKAFRVPVDEWLRGPLRPLLEQHASHGRLVDEEWFNRKTLQKHVREHLAGKNSAALLWPALVLGIWLDGAGRCFATP